MIRVTARTALHLATLLGGREVELEVPEGSTVGDVLAQLARRMGEQATPALVDPASGRPQRHLRIMLNGRDIGVVGGLEAVVREGDDVLVLPPAGGG